MRVVAGLPDDLYRVLAVVPMIPRCISRCLICGGFLSLLWPVAVCADGPTPTVSGGTVRITVPQVVLRGVSVRSLRVTVLRPDGEIDQSYNGTVRLTGVRLTDGSPTGAPRTDFVLQAGELA